MDFFTQPVGTTKVWQYILLTVSVLITAILIISYIGGKMEERAAKKATTPAPNTGVPAAPSLANEPVASQAQPAM